MLWIIGQETTVKKKITCFLKSIAAPLFTIFVNLSFKYK